MCTLSIIRVSAPESPGTTLGFRVVASRDEERDRPAALAPRWRPLDQLQWGGEGATRAIWPTDPRGGGTWIGAGDSGLVLCLLNVNLEPPAALPANLTSRGVVIPRLIGFRNAARAMERLESLELDRFAPFRLVAADISDNALRIIEARWDRDDLQFTTHGSAPVCFVSSGLGDSKALPRLPLFESVVPRTDATPEAQDEFHAHRWPDRPEVSVLMSRAEARTVSVTTVDVARRAVGMNVRMGYRPIVPSADELPEVGVSPRSVAASGTGV
jgi:uncharacterized protein with NRDE domain